MAPMKRKTIAQRTGTQALAVLRTSGADMRKGTKGKKGKEQQYDWIEAYCVTMGYGLAPLVFFDDGVSGTNKLDQRPALVAALNYAAENGIDVIVMMDTERLGRETEAFSNVRNAFIALGIRLETAKERLNHCDADSKFMSNIYAAVAEQDKDNTVKKLYMGRRVKSKRDGLGSGPLPYGYVRSADGSIVADAAAAPTIRAVLECRLTMSYRQACAWLNEHGYTTPAGRAWNVGSLQRIEQHAELYRTGTRQWGDVTASVVWPVLV